MAMGPARLYLRCVRWGLSTGAVAGAGTAAVVGFLAGDDLGDGTFGARVGLAPASALYGIVIGAVVAIVPTAIGGAVVVAIMASRDPGPASEEAARRDLSLLFLAVIGILDVAAVALLASLDGWDAILLEGPLVIVGTACVAGMLWRARSSIIRGWAGG
jgi:hypothetical protein